MTALVWNKTGERMYEIGVDHAVLYIPNSSGVYVNAYPWNGLISVEENSSGGESEEYYQDGVKYLDFVLNETYQATLQAFSAPDAFAVCEGRKSIVPGLFVTNQVRAPFGLVYRTRIGNDVDGSSKDYKLHLVYNATVQPASRNNETINETPSPTTFQWTINAVPVPSTIYKPCAQLVVDSRSADPTRLTNLQNYLFGTASIVPSLLTQTQVISILS